MIYNGEIVDISYAGSQPLSMTYDGATYYYVLNGQGDVIGLTDDTGKMVIGYHYGAYGVVMALASDPDLAPVLIKVNPLMYRGYVYDRETKLYYLQSRYYDPELGRFINADAYASTGQGVLGNNMFAYCLNNPVNYIDSNGNLPLAALIPGLIGGIVGGVVAAISSVVRDDSGEQTTFNIVKGASLGAIFTYFPRIGIAYSAVQVGNAAIECLYHDFSVEEATLYIALAVISEAGLPQTGFSWIDSNLTPVYGMIKSVLCMLLSIDIENNNPNPYSRGAVSNAIYSVLLTGSLGAGCMGMTTICFDMIGGQSLCYRL